MPSFAATASVSAMIVADTRDTSGWRAISSSVAPVSALIGLNATLPSSLTQISWRICVVIGQRNPAAISASAIAPAALGAAAVGLAEADAIALGVPDDAGLDDVGREIDKRADDAPRLDRRTRSRRPDRRARAAARRARRRSSGSTTTECRSAC